MSISSTAGKVMLAAWLVLGSTAFAQSVSEPGRAAFAAGDYTRAMEVWRPLAESGDAHAQFNIGLLHDEGLGTPQSTEDARKWWRMAAEQGLIEADHNLALLEIELVSQDPATGDMNVALVHLNRAADAGYLRARYTLGKLYELGLGVDEDAVMSAQQIRTAAEGGLPRAQYNMGKRHRDGSGVTQDDVMAVKWFRRAALAGHPGAQDHYARRLKNGTGTEADPVGAMVMAILAARAGHEEAAELANDLKVPLSLGELDQAFTRANAFQPESVTGPVE
jgi:TPR repeat protein